MSFSFEFHATAADARAIVQEEHAPTEVKRFLTQALTAFTDDRLVHVKAVGHLYHGDYDWSNATVLVTPLTLRVPRPIVENKA